MLMNDIGALYRATTSIIDVVQHNLNAHGAMRRGNWL
jgi:hypothetical protein